MLRNALIILSALLLALGLTAGLYWDEVDQMVHIIQNHLDETDTDPVEEDGDIQAESLQIDTSAGKTVYAYGEAFTTEGLLITVKMSDGSTREVPLTECTVLAPDTTQVGQRQVTVYYGGIAARYEVTIHARTMKPVSEVSLVEIPAHAGKAIYRIEAERIDMAATHAVKASGAADFVGTASENRTSGGKYLTGFGVSGNYFGFTFHSEEAYENVSVVLRVGNSSKKRIDAGVVTMYLNYHQDENGRITGEIPLDGYAIEPKRVGNWSDIVIRGLEIQKGTNVIAFEVMDRDLAFDLDYLDLYVGQSYVSSLVEITETTTVIQDIEKLDTEKAFTRQDVADNLGLGMGELCISTPSNVPDGKTTHGGVCVDAIGKGSQISTTLRLAEDATVRIRFKASAAGRGDYYVSDHWNFYVDGVKLSTVERVNIEGGDAAAGIWWDWIYTDIGVINFPAGDYYFMFEITGTDCNVDTVEFEVLSWGSYHESGIFLDGEDPSVQPAAVIAETGATKIEMENLDLSLSDIVTRSDFIPAVGAGNVGSGGGRIYGFDQGTTFRMQVKITKACTVEIALAGFGTPMDQFVYKFNGTVLTPASHYGSGEVAEGSLGTVEVTEPGVYLFEFTSGIGCDLDYVSFTVVE